MARKSFFGRLVDKVKSIFVEEPKPTPPPKPKPQAKPRPSAPKKPEAKTTPAKKPQPVKVSRDTKTAMILNGSINPTGNELVDKSSYKNFKTVGKRKYKVQFEYYNDGSDEPNFMSVQSSQRLTTNQLIEIFQKHTEYGIEGSDEQPFNVTRAKIWMN